MNIVPIVILFCAIIAFIISLGLKIGIYKLNIPIKVIVVYRILHVALGVIGTVIVGEVIKLFP